LPKALSSLQGAEFTSSGPRNQKPIGYLLVLYRHNYSSKLAFKFQFDHQYTRLLKGQDPAIGTLKTIGTVVRPGPWRSN